MPKPFDIGEMPLDVRPMNSHNARLKAAPGKRYKYREPSKWKRHEFVCFDGEGFDVKGRHEYVYLAAFDGKEIFSIKDSKGLDTETCFEFLAMVAKAHKYGICVIYGGSYDSNMMMRDIPIESLKQLHKTGHLRWGDWFIRYAQRKYLQVTHLPTKRTCQLWDVIGFFQSTFEFSLQSWLDVKDDVIAAGKKGRGSFTARRLDSFVIPYCNTELQYFQELMQALYIALVNAGFKLNRWDGSGAIASFLFYDHKMLEHKGTEQEQERHYDKARGAYAGGRFELFQPGDYKQPVYNYDINSAYPYAIALLPPFTKLIRKDPSSPVQPYDLCYISYDNTESMIEMLGPVTNAKIRAREGTTEIPPTLPGIIHPFFHRSKQQLVKYPPIVERWCWGVEIIAARHAGFSVDVQKLLHWPDNGERPWQWVAQLFDHRKLLKAEGNSAEKAIKLGLNSLYGKMVQQKGWHPGEDIPKTHQLFWGGWVTAKTRAMIFEAMMYRPEAIIAVETDGLYSTEKLPLDLGDGLGQWDFTEYEEFTYLQSGMYFGVKKGETISKYRGLDKGSLLREAVLNAYETDRKIQAPTTRFRTIGTSLVSDSRMTDWRQWITETKEIVLESIVISLQRYFETLVRSAWTTVVPSGS